MNYKFHLICLLLLAFVLTACTSAPSNNIPTEQLSESGSFQPGKHEYSYTFTGENSLWDATCIVSGYVNFFRREDTGSIGSEGVYNFKLVLTYKEKLPDSFYTNNLMAMFDNGMEQRSCQLKRGEGANDFIYESSSEQTYHETEESTPVITVTWNGREESIELNCIDYTENSNIPGK